MLLRCGFRLLKRMGVSDLLASYNLDTTITCGATTPYMTVLWVGLARARVSIGRGSR